MFYQTGWFINDWVIMTYNREKQTVANSSQHSDEKAEIN